MNFLTALMALSLQLSALAQESQSTAHSCPKGDLQYIVANPWGGSAQLFTYLGLKSYLLIKPELEGIDSKDFNGKSFWVKFDSQMNTSLYSTKDCSVVGKMIVNDLSCDSLSIYYPCIIE